MLFKKLTLCAAMVATVTLSHAVILVPDAYTPLPGIPFIAGTVVQDVLTPFSFSAYGGTVSGMVQNRVLLKSDGTYAFIWKVTNDATSAGPVQDLRLGGFITDVYDGDWASSSLGSVNPTQAYLFSKPGGFVNFNFTQPTGGSSLVAGTSSYMFFLNSDATHYGLVATYDLTDIGQGSESVQYQTFAPQAVPEPASLAILGLGLFLLVRPRKTQ